MLLVLGLVTATVITIAISVEKDPLAADNRGWVKQRNTGMSKTNRIF